MKKKTNFTTDSTLTIAACLLISITGLCADPGALVQTQDDDRTREAFLFSRETTSTKRTNGKIVRKKRRNPIAEKTDQNNEKTGKQKDPVSGYEATIKALYNSEHKDTEWTEPPAAAYTLFRQIEEGNWVAVDSSEIFQRGQVLRFVIESAQDGYLYVFNTTNSNSPQMIYPHPSLNDGANRIQAHVPYEIPSRNNPDFTGFELVDGGVSEEIWLVISRTPIASVPTDELLVSLCQNERSECPWQPSLPTWDAVIAHQKSTITIDSRPTETASLSGTMEKAITRHIRLKPKAKGTEPAVIFRRRTGIIHPLALRISLMVR